MFLRVDGIVMRSYKVVRRVEEVKMNYIWTSLRMDIIGGGEEGL